MGTPWVVFVLDGIGTGMRHRTRDGNAQQAIPVLVAARKYVASSWLMAGS
jgi:hypothetical protein